MIIIYSLHWSSAPYYAENNSLFTCYNHLSVLPCTGFITAEWFIYQNVQYFITSRTVVLHFTTVKYSLHKCSVTILR